MDIVVHILLGLASVTALAAINWRGWALRWNKVVPPPIVGALTKCRSRKENPDVRHLREAQPPPLGHLGLTATKHLDWPREEDTGLMEIPARHEIVKLKCGLVAPEISVTHYLNTLNLWIWQRFGLNDKPCLI
jgi:hypothetical protein